MGWKKERDLLIAQTMAFVQSVAGKATGAEAKDLQGWDEPGPPDQPAEMVPPVEAIPAVRVSPAHYSELREEIRGRVAAFRAHQELFLRDRDEYCDSILAKVRAATGHPPKAGENRPAKR
ncbi:MAG TPA: hypothetical protein VKS24_18580 [Bradyrhizobium sp.]|nr:hypothetical protein [Bradyrhizobium sp.]